MQSYKFGLGVLALILMISASGYACDWDKDGKHETHDMKAMQHHESMSKNAFNNPMVKMHKDMMAAKSTRN